MSKKRIRVSKKLNFRLQFTEMNKHRLASMKAKKKR